MDSKLIEFVKNKLIKVDYFDTDSGNQISGFLTDEIMIRFSLFFNEKSRIDEKWVLCLAKASTFDRWSNSNDIEIKIPCSWKIEEQKKRIEDSFELAELLFKSVPDKYWNKFLRVTY